MLYLDVRLGLLEELHNGLEAGLADLLGRVAERVGVQQQLLLPVPVQLFQRGPRQSADLVGAEVQLVGQVHEVAGELDQVVVRQVHRGDPVLVLHLDVEGRNFPHLCVYVYV